MGGAGRVAAAGRAGVAVAAAVVLVGAVLGAGWAAPAGAQGGATATLVLAPDPPVGFEPFTVVVTGQGCEPGATVDVTLWGWNSHSDVVTQFLLDDAQVEADGAGDWQAELSVVAGWPIPYSVDPGCGAAELWPTVAPPPGFTASASPTTVTLGVPAVIELAGYGCPSPLATWGAGPVPEWLWSGTVAVAGDGSWAATAAFTVPEDYTGNGTGLWLSMSCVVEGVYLHYQAAHLEVLPAPVPTTTTTTLPSGGDGPEDPPVVPRFTG